MFMLTPRAPVWAGVIAVILSLTVSALGASPEPGDPVYHSLRYDDNFTYLADPSKSSDPWDPFKYIPIGDGQYGPSYLSFGGELRERAESYLSPNFGLNAPRANAYLLHRLLLNADVEVTDYVRAFFQIGNMQRLGDRGVASTTDVDHFDLMQGFVDLKPPSPLGDSPIVRIGREELSFGFQRLIAVREGPNVRRDFDGLRFNDHIGNATIDLITVRPINDSEDVFDDHTNHNQILWGSYLTVPVGAVLKADLYWLNYENEAARYRGLTGVEKRQTFGVRLFGNSEGFDWNGELALQTGTFRGHDIRADMLAGIVGYTFLDLPWQPRIGVETNLLSGDNAHSSAIGTFNAMYPRLPYFAETSLLVPANVYDVRPVLSFKPQPNVMATFGWDSLWRASSSDGLYGSGMVEYANTNKVSSSRIGTELSADVRWRIDQHLLLGAIAAEFISGPAVQEAFGKNVTFFVLFANYRF
jgi:alginate export protein